jgi:predicted nucleotidyltransferase
MIAQESIHRIAGALKAAAPVGSKIFLFGSHAKGTAREGSDLDLMVVEPKVDDRIAEANRLYQAIRPFRLPVDILVTSRADFDQWSAVRCTVHNEVARHGREL